MRTTLLLTIALATALLTGCIGNAAEKAPPTTPVELQSTNTGEDASLSLPAKPTRTSLDVTAAVSQPWAKPGDAVTLTAASTKATSFSWYLQLRPASAAPAASGGHSGHRALLGEDESFNSAMFGPGHGSGPEPAGPKPQPKFETGNIEAGKTSKILQFNQEGLYQFHCHPHPWMKMNITVKAGASNAQQTVTILDGRAQGEYRYAPEDLVVAPGTKVQFVNKGAQMHTATQEAYLELIPGDGKSITFTPQTTGDYDVVVIARDATTGVGVAKARLLVDATKPEEKQTIGPYSGELEKGIPNAPEDQQSQATHTFTSPFAFKTLKLSFTSASNLPGGVIPAPTSIKISLAPEGGAALATSDPSANGELAFDMLPAGSYVLTVIADTGVMIGYTVTGEAMLDLQLPDASAPVDESAPHH